MHQPPFKGSYSGANCFQYFQSQDSATAKKSGDGVGWTQECRDVFDLLKDVLVLAPLLAYADDFSFPFQL